MSELVTIQAKFIKFIFHNKDNKFSVAVFELNDMSEKEVIVTGYFNGFEKDVFYLLKGQYVEHVRYGMQFQTEEVERLISTNYDDLVSFLSSSLFVGIGKKYAETIVDTLGVNCIELIKDDINVLQQVPKMNIKRKAAIIEGIGASQDDLQKQITFFKNHGINLRNCIKIECTYGAEAIKIISENPYKLVEDIDGIGFTTADKLAMSLNFSLDNVMRLESALISVVMECSMASGDTYVDIDILPEALIKKTQVNNLDFDSVLSGCLLKRFLIQEENRIYHHTQYIAENIIANYLAYFPQEKIENPGDLELETLIDELQKSEHIEYDKIQVEAINSFFTEDVLICTGGPGTGKTTVVKALVSLFRNSFPYYQIQCCAPTGRAAKRLAELTGVPCSTIHSLLKWDLETNSFGKNDTEPLSIDCLIIDEFSMVDSWLFSNLLKAGTQFKKICIIGDEDQLPSVSCGSVLKDLIDSKLFKTIRLQTIFRQKDGSDVIKLAHNIRNSKDTSNSFNGDVVFFNYDQYSVKKAVTQVVSRALEKGYTINDIQVLASKYNGVAGIDRLNVTLQESFNPPSSDKREFKVGYRVFRENDKILQLKNQVDDDVFNGDIGTLVEIVYPEEDHNNKTRLIVDFDGIFVEYTSENILNITHAYCISVHKSQGSEYPIVIMPIVKEAMFMLQKRLLYTAITRAKKSLILVGEQNVWNYGLNNKERSRNTTLIMRLNAENNVNR